MSDEAVTPSDEQRMIAQIDALLQPATSEHNTTLSGSRRWRMLWIMMGLHIVLSVIAVGWFYQKMYGLEKVVYEQPTYQPNHNRDESRVFPPSGHR